MGLLSLGALGLAVLTFCVVLVRPRAGLLLLVVTIPFMTFAVPRLGPGLNAETILYGAALISILLQVRPVLPPARYLAPILAYFAVMFLSFLVLATWYDPKENLDVSLVGWIPALKSTLWPTLGFFIAYSICRERNQREQVLIAMAVALLISAGSGMLTPDRVTAGSATSRRIMGSLFNNPNELGAFLAIFSVICIDGAWRKDLGRLTRLFYAVVWIVSVVGLILTLSRGSWLAFVVGHAAWLFLRRGLVVLIPAATAGILLAWGAYVTDALPEPISKRIEESISGSRSTFQGGLAGGVLDESAAARFVLYRMAFDMFVDSPVVGQGFRGFNFKDREYGKRYGILRRSHKAAQGTSPESLYARVAAENGLMGLAVLGWLSWMLFGTARGLYRSQEPESSMGVLLLCILAGTGTACLTQGALQLHEISLPFWLLCGVSARARLESLYNPEPEPELALDPGPELDHAVLTQRS